MFHNRNGTVLIWKKKTGALSQRLSGFDKAVFVDMTANIIIAGSHNGYIKMWSKTSDECKNTLTIGESVGSIQICPSQK